MEIFAAQPSKKVYTTYTDLNATVDHWYMIANVAHQNQSLAHLHRVKAKFLCVPDLIHLHTMLEIRVANPAQIVLAVILLLPVRVVKMIFLKLVPHLHVQIMPIEHVYYRRT